VIKQISGYQTYITLITYKSYQYTIKVNFIYSWEQFGITDTDEIFCIRSILEKQWQYNEAVYQKFTAFKKAHDSVREHALYKILNGATSIKTCTYK
jgi:hypothetical protein